MKTIHATYHNGAFHPVEPVALPAGAMVEISIPESIPGGDTRDRFEAAIGAFPPEVLDKMEADIQEAFGQIDGDAWQ